MKQEEEELNSAKQERKNIYTDEKIFERIIIVYVIFTALLGVLLWLE